MDLEELRLFLAVAQHGAFNAAADSLGVPRSTLRRRVDALEARARIPLLNRTAQGIALTEAGKVLAERGRTMLEGASALLDSIREVGEEPVGVLRVVMPVGPPRHVLTELFAGLRAAYPKLRMRGRFSDAPLGEPLTDTDVAFHFDRSPPKGPWLSEILLEMPRRLLASQDYLSRRGVPAVPEDLAAHELLVWQPPGEAPDQLPLLSGGHVQVDPPSFRATPAPFDTRRCSASASRTPPSSESTIRRRPAPSFPSSPTPWAAPAPSASASLRSWQRSPRSASSLNGHDDTSATPDTSFRVVGSDPRRAAHEGAAGPGTGRDARRIVVRAQPGSPSGIATPRRAHAGTLHTPTPRDNRRASTLAER